MPKIEPYELKDAQALVEDALQRSQTRHNRWRALEHLFRTGQAEGLLSAAAAQRAVDEVPGLTLDAINLALPHMTMIIASAVDRAPEFIVEPYGGDEGVDQAARAAEEVLRYHWKRLNGTDIHRDMVQDMVVVGNGFAKVGWSFVEETFDKDEDELAAELEELLEAERKDALLGRREPRDEDELFELVDQVRSEVVTDEPWLQYVSPYDIFVPATARRIDEARWVAHRIIVPLDEVRANPAFNGTDGLQPAGNEDRPEQRSSDEKINSGSGEDDPFTEVTLFEFYDMRARRLLVFQLGADKPLYDGELPYDHRYTPFVHMRNFEDGGSRFWSFGDLENVAAIQLQFNDYVHEQMGNANRAGNKYAVAEDAWDDELKDALESDKPDVVFKVKGNRPVNDLIQALERKGLSSDVYAAKGELQLHMQEVLGLNDFQTGGTGADRMSATAAAVVDGTATLRASDKRRQVERAVARTGLLLLLGCQENLDEEMALRIVGEGGDVSWLKVDKDTIRGEFGISVSSGSTMAVNPATRQQRAVELMTQVIPALAAEGYDTHPLWRRAIRDYGLDPDRLLVKLAPPMDPMAVDPSAGVMDPALAGLPAGRADVEVPGEAVI